MNVISSSVEVRALAAKGLAAVAAQPAQQGQYSTGDQYLASVATQAPATSAERLLAATLRECTSKSLKYTTALNAQRATLQVLAAGVGGAVGPALASLGLQVSRGAYNQEDQYSVGAPWLRAISREGQPLEKDVAQAALTVTNQSLRYPTAIASQQEALNLVSGGVAGTSQAVVAQYGQTLMRRAYNQEDQHKIAQQLLPVLASAAGSPAGTAVAKVANSLMASSMKYSTAVAAEMHAFQAIAAPPTADVDVARAAWALNSIRTAYNMEDQYLVGNVTLAALAGNAASPAVASLAQGARAALSVSMKYHSAVGFQRAVLERVNGGVATFEKTMAQVGQQLRSLAYNQEDQYNLGRGLVDQIAAGSSDPQVQALARYGKQVCSAPGVTYAQALQAQNAVFDGIVSGNLSVPAAVVTTGGPSAARIALPVVDPNAPPETQKAALEDCIAQNKQALRALEGEEKKVSGEVAKAQQRLQEINDGARALADQEAPLVARYNKLGKLSSLAGVVAAGGMLAAATIGSPVAVAAGLVGVGGFVATQMLRSRTREKIFALRHEAELKTWEVLSLQGQVQMGATRAAELRKAQGMLGTLKMATAPTIVADTTVCVEDDFVMVGGLRIPRNNASTRGDETAA